MKFSFKCHEIFRKHLLCKKKQNFLFFGPIGQPSAFWWPQNGHITLLVAISLFYPNFLKYLKPSTLCQETEGFLFLFIGQIPALWWPRNISWYYSITLIYPSVDKPIFMADRQWYWSYYVGVSLKLCLGRHGSLIKCYDYQTAVIFRLTMYHLLSVTSSVVLYPVALA